MKKDHKTSNSLSQSLSPTKLFSQVESFFNGEDEENSLSAGSTRTGVSYMMKRVVLPLLSLF